MSLNISSPDIPLFQANKLLPKDRSHIISHEIKNVYYLLLPNGNRGEDTGTAFSVSIRTSILKRGRRLFPVHPDHLK
jgi:hypothetical protein